MSKLFKLKKWLTVPDAAKHLSMVFGEEVTEADVLRFALEGDLRLSVHLVNGAYARMCFLINFNELEWHELPSLDGNGTMKIAKGGRIFGNEKGCFQVSQNVAELENGVWDLPMTGGERVDVEFRYQQLTDGPKVTAVSLDGVFVASTNGDLKEIQSHFSDNPHFNKSDLKSPFLHPDNFHPAGALPDDSVFVVRTDALLDFMQAVNGTQSRNEKPLGTNERNQLLKMVFGMAIDSYGYDPLAKKSEATKQIVDDLAKLGIGIDPDTVRKYLKEAANTVTYEMPKPK